MREAIDAPKIFTPQHFVCKAHEDHIPNYAHFASPMVPPTTGETITSYKRLMNDPETTELWQTAYGKDFGGMVQGDKKTGQKGTNSIFVMKHDKINSIPNFLLKPDWSWNAMANGRTIIGIELFFPFIIPRVRSLDLARGSLRKMYRSELCG